MKLLSLIVLPFLFYGSDFLTELNQFERKPLICHAEKKIITKGLACASEFQIVFTEAQKKSALKNDYFIQGYVVNDGNRLPGISVNYGVYKNGVCSTSPYVVTDTKGCFCLNVKRKKESFIQFTGLGFKSVLIFLKN
jgi:hypothetical protein